MSFASEIAEAKPSARPAGAGAGGHTGESGRPSGRRCIITRAVRPREELLRFVLGPDGSVVPDMAAKLPGRGIWVSSRREALERACSKNAFSRVAKAQARVPSDLVSTVEALLVERCLRLVELARRAGEAAGGYEKVQEWIRSGQVRMLLVARDGSPSAKAKLRGLAKGAPLVELFDAAELGSAFGRDHVVNAAVASGGLARRLETELFRLSGFRTADEGK